MTTALKRFIASSGWGLAASVCLHADEVAVPVGVGLLLVAGWTTGHHAAHVLNRGHPVVAEDRTDAAGVRADIGTEGLRGGAARGQSERAGEHQDSYKRLHVTNDGRQRRWVSRQDEVGADVRIFRTLASHPGACFSGK